MDDELPPMDRHYAAIIANVYAEHLTEDAIQLRALIPVYKQDANLLGARRALLAAQAIEAAVKHLRVILEYPRSRQA